MNIGNVEIEAVVGDIADQPDITAVVNAANAGLLTGSGVAGAIHRGAGPGLEKECKKHAPIKPGEAVITGAHNLPNSYVIHCLGPVYGVDRPEDSLLADCYKKCLQITEENSIDSIAFPALSTGAFGYPAEDAAKIALRVIREKCPSLNHIKKIRFVLFSRSDLDIYNRQMEKLFS